MNMDVEAEFNVDDAICYLDHAADSIWPLRAKSNVVAFAQEVSARGALNEQHRKEKEEQLRVQLRELINARSVEEIAILKNTSEGLSTIAYGLDWEEYDNVVIPDECFPANRVVWESLATLGVSTRVVSVGGGNENPEWSLIAAIDNRTRIVSVSGVQNESGLKLDLRLLGRECKRRGVLLCVDAIQHLGALDFNVQEIQADFVVADGHKWMMGPEGVALFYCHSRHIDKLKLHSLGWKTIGGVGSKPACYLKYVTGAKRFECGSLNTLGIYALTGSLSLILEYGTSNIERLLDKNVVYLFRGLERIKGVIVRSNTDKDRRSGIVSFNIIGVDSDNVCKDLRKSRIICSSRSGSVRLSPHFHTKKMHLDRALEVIDQLTHKYAILTY